MARLGICFGTQSFDNTGLKLHRKRIRDVDCDLNSSPLASNAMPIKLGLL